MGAAVGAASRLLQANLTMCDPVSIGLTLMAGSVASTAYSAHESRKDAKAASAAQREQLDAASRERERVETEAVQSAQMEMSRTKSRRRDTLLGRGAGSLTSPTAEGTKTIQPPPSMLSRGASFLG
jgi:hypothetical protein